VVVNGQEGKPYDRLLTLAGGRIVFAAPDRLHYLAMRGSDVFAVQETLSGIR
jgi:hypothetical protein